MRAAPRLTVGLSLKAAHFDAALACHVPGLWLPLVVGLGTRAALALLGMTLVIEVFVYPDA